MKTKIELPDELILMLDGKGDEEIQRIVDSVKSRIEIEQTGLTPEQSAVVNAIINHAITQGRLGFTAKRLTYCKCCKKSAGYVKFKSGPRRGQNNTNKPLSFNGLDFSTSCLSVSGHASVGCCTECYENIKPVLLERLAVLQAEIPERITGEKPRYKWYRNRKCRKCGWEGSERLMGKKRTLMGDGYYPASCPSCNAENIFFGPTIIGFANGFEIYKLP